MKEHLGHEHTQTTTNFYAGLDTRRASRFQAELIEKIRAGKERTPRPTRKRSATVGSDCSPRMGAGHELTSSPSRAPPLFKPNRRIRVALRLEDWPADDQRRWNAAFVRGGSVRRTGRLEATSPRARACRCLTPTAAGLASSPGTIRRRWHLPPPTGQLRRGFAYSRLCSATRTADARSRAKSGTFAVPSVCSPQRWTRAGC